MRVAIALVLVACGGDPSKSRTTSSSPTAGSGSADAGVVAIDAGVAVANDAKPNDPCFCFSWVHLDENGQSCFADQSKCDAEFKAFGRTDKIPCRSEQRPEWCASYACRNIGKECFRL